MNPHSFFAKAGLGIAVGLSGCTFHSADQGNERSGKPNIVLIMADDIGYEAVGCYGGESYATPNLDRLAAEGMLFSHAYSQPLCTPTRIQLMTGKYNYRNWMAFGILDPAETTFGHMMQAAGYKTCISGKWQLWSYNPPGFEPEFRGLGMRPEDAGFDEWFLWHARHTEEKGSRYPDPVILDNGEMVPHTKGKYGPDLFVDYICGFMERNLDHPFFVYYPMALPHDPFSPAPDSDDWVEGDRYLDDAEKYFGDMVSYLDKLTGRIVNKIDELGISENTLILFYSDNGTHQSIRSLWAGQWVQGGKGLPTDAGTRVPMIARWTGTIPAGTVNNDLISSVDFIPAMADVAGFDPEAYGLTDGVSFAPQLKGKPGKPRETLICWHDPRPGAMKEAFTKLDLWARDKRYKLYDDGRLYDVPDDILELHPIAEGSGPEEAEEARVKLRMELDKIPKDKRAPEWDPYKAFANR